MRHQYKYPNDLSVARKRLSLSCKRVSSLIGKTPHTLTRYESGAAVPPLRTLLKLEIIYRMPVAFLYPSLYRNLREELRARESLNERPREVFRRRAEEGKG